MLERLGSALGTEHARLEARERQHDDTSRTRLEALSFIAGGVALIAAVLGLVLGYLGINTGDVRPTDSVLSNRLLPAYGAILLVILGSIPVWFAVWRVSRGRSAERAARASERAAEAAQDAAEAAQDAVETIARGTDGGRRAG